MLRKVQTGKSKTKHKIFKVEDTELYDRLIGNEAIVNVVGSYYEVDEKEFKKIFDKKTKDLKEWLKTDKPIELANRYVLNEAWKNMH